MLRAFHFCTQLVLHAAAFGRVPLRCASSVRMSASDERLLAQWQAGTLPFEEWTHEAHLRVLFQLACMHSEPLPIMAEGIKKYNTLHEERLSVGFHETLTRFWVQAVVKRKPRDFDDFESFAKQYPELLDSSTALDFYDRRILFSEQARSEWVPPLEWRPHPGSCPCPGEQQADRTEDVG
jgi:hypothetical protein